MVGFIDQRPDGKDTLRQLVTKLRTPSSVPFGNKVASAGEGVTFVTSAGDSLRWDGDTLAAFDTRMENAVKVVQASRANLEATKTRLEEAERRIQEAEATGANVDTEAIATNVQRRLVQSKTPWIDGRNLIVPGTIDTRQLNVTGELAANIVRSMSAETKKLVVTEEAILNNLTVIENIVTPELVTKKIKTRELAAEMIAGGLIQTSTQERQGVKLSDDGIIAYDSAGNITAHIKATGKDHYIRGKFSTGGDGKAGVQIYATEPHPITGFRDSFIEMRPRDDQDNAHRGVIYTSDQGAIRLVLLKPSQRLGEARGITIDSNGGLNVEESIRIRYNMRLTGFMVRTDTMTHLEMGPFAFDAYGGQRYPISHVDLGFKRTVVAMPAGNISWPPVIGVEPINGERTELVVRNPYGHRIENIWVHVTFIPYNRNT